MWIDLKTAKERWKFSRQHLNKLALDGCCLRRKTKRFGIQYDQSSYDEFFGFSGGTTKQEKENMEPEPAREVPKKTQAEADVDSPSGETDKRVNMAKVKIALELEKLKALKLKIKIEDERLKTLKAKNKAAEKPKLIGYYEIKDSDILRIKKIFNDITE